MYGENDTPISNSLETQSEDFKDHHKIVETIEDEINSDLYGTLEKVEDLNPEIQIKTFEIIFEKLKTRLSSTRE